MTPRAAAPRDVDEQLAFGLSAASGSRGSIPPVRAQLVPRRKTFAALERAGHSEPSLTGR